MAEFYINYEYWIAAAQLFLAMLGMGATLSVEDFYDVAREPWAVGVGVSTQLLMVPLITFAFIQLLGLGGGLMVGLAIIAAIPGGATSNVFTHVAGGNTPLSISITGITTAACLLSTPLVLQLLLADTMPDDFVMPAGRIALEIAVYLLLPLMMGMILLKLLPRIAPGFSKWSVRASLGLIVLIVVGSGAADKLDVEQFGMSNITLGLSYLLLLSALGYIVPKLLGVQRRDRVAIEIEVMVRNISLGILVKASLFPASADDPIGNFALFMLLLYGGVQMLTAMPVMFVRRWQLSSV